MSNDEVNTNNKTVKEKVKPSKLFEEIKNNLGVIDKMTLNRYLKVSNKLLAKAEITKQDLLVQRLEFRIKTLAKEIELVNKHNINKYVEKDTIFKYIEETELREVKLSSVSDYMREIPDEAVDMIADTREVFDDFFILFTDYTGETAKQAEQMVIDKDPILFGIFYDDSYDEVMERFYFLYDWEDEYCDLTLDKLIEEYKEISDEDVTKTTETSITKATKDLKKEAKEMSK